MNEPSGEDIDNKIYNFLKDGWKTRSQISDYLHKIYGSECTKIKGNFLISRLNVLCRAELLYRQVSMRWPYEIVYKANLNNDLQT